MTRTGKILCIGTLARLVRDYPHHHHHARVRVGGGGGLGRERLESKRTHPHYHQSSHLTYALAFPLVFKHHHINATTRSYNPNDEDKIKSAIAAGPGGSAAFEKLIRYVGRRMKDSLVAASASASASPVGHEDEQERRVTIGNPVMGALEVEEGDGGGSDQNATKSKDGGARIGGSEGRGSVVFL